MSEKKSTFRGWNILAVTVLTQALALGGTTYVFSLYIIPVTEEFKASRFSMGIGMAIFLFAMAAYSPVVGRLLDKGNKRNIMALGCVLIAVGFALMSQATAIWQLGVLIALFVASGACMMGSLPSATLVANWFSKYRGRAMGITAMGTSLGGFIMPLVVAPLIDSLGWRGSFICVALAMLLIALPAVWLVVVNVPADLKQYPDGRQIHDDVVEVVVAEQAEDDFRLMDLLKKLNFWSINLSIALPMFAGVLLSVHLVPFAAEMGISAVQAAYVLSIFAAAGIVGKLIFGFMIDSLHTRNVLWLVLVIEGVGWLTFMDSFSYSQFLLGVSIMGFGAGGGLPIMNSLIAECFGISIYGRIMGIAGVLMMSLIALPGPLGGWVYDQTNSYLLVYELTFWVFPAAILVAFFIRVPKIQPA